jgi:hypothetical protein
MIQDRLKDFLRRHDPARAITPQRLARLEVSILERLALTPQFLLDDMPGLMPGFRVLALPLVPSIFAACLLVLLGAFVGRGLIETRIAGTTVMGVHSSATEIKTPWHAWVDAQTEGAVQP